MQLSIHSFIFKPRWYEWEAAERMLDEDHVEQSSTCSCTELVIVYVITVHVGQVIHQELFYSAASE